MEFFSSEEHVKEWEKEHPELGSDIVIMEQGLAIITAFGGSRLDYDYEAPLDLMLNTAKFGLDRDFWKIG
jgi:hypothetical protein